MVCVHSLYYTFSTDFRFFKKIVKKRGIKTFVYTGIVPLASLMCIKSLGQIAMSNSTLSKTKQYEIAVSSDCSYWFIVFLRFEPNNVLYTVDSSFWLLDTRIHNLTYVLSCYFTNIFFIISSPVGVMSNCNSLSRVYTSFVWLEREISEFSNIFFKGLRDSRRLLTDYTLKYSNQDSSYKTSSYSSLIQDIFI